MSQIVCSCGAQAVCPAGTFGAQAKETGFFPVFNVRDGLTIEWVCPACAPKVREALQRLAEVFGEDRLRYLHLGSMVGCFLNKGE